MQRTSSWTAAALASLAHSVLAPSASAAAKKPSVESVLTELADVREFRQVEISPDGRRVAWCVKIRDRQGAWKLGAVEVGEVGAPSAPARRITAAGDGQPHDERSPVWSPDGTRDRVPLRRREGRPAAGLDRAGVRRPGAAPDQREGAARAAAVVAGRQADRRPVRRGLDPGARRARRLQARRRRRVRGRRGAADRDRRDRDGRACARSARRTCTSTTTTGRPTARRSPRKRSKARAPTTTGSRSSTWCDADTRRGALDLEAAAADRRPALVARRQIDRGDPRHHERRRVDRRRHLRRARGRRRGEERHAATRRVGAARSRGGLTAEILFQRVRRRRQSALVTRRRRRRDAHDAVVGAAADHSYFVDRASGDAASAVVQSFRERARGLRGRRSAPGPRRPHVNAPIKPLWGEAKSLHWTSDKLPGAGMAASIPPNFDPAKKIPAGRLGPRRTVVRELPVVAVALERGAAEPGLLRAAAEPARQLRQRRGVHAGQRQRLRLRRPARHRGRRRRGGEGGADRSATASASSAGATAAT